jgi:hypothetical protein
MEEIIGKLEGMYREAYVIADDGSRTDATGYGAYQGFTVFFVVSASDRNFRLIWLDNPPIDLGE